MNQNSQPTDVTLREIAIRRRVHRLAEFYRHLMTYIATISVMWIVNGAMMAYYGATPGKWYHWWAMWPTLGWGLGLLIHGITVLPTWNFFTEDWEERKVRELMEREGK